MKLNYAIVPVTPFQQNATLLWEEGTTTAVVTDPGGDLSILEHEAAARGVSIDAVWLTHGHLDHVGGAAALQQRGLNISGPERGDAFWLEQLPLQARQFGFGSADVFSPDQWLEEGAVLSLGQHQFEVLHIPGHTPGHVVFYCAQADLLIAGDVLFRESIGRTDFPGGNHADLLANIRSKLFRLPEETVVIPGHGPLTTIGHEKRFNPFLHPV